MTALAYKEEWLPSFDGTQFYTRTYAASLPKAAVLFVHGFAEHVGRYEHVHPTWPAHAITLFAFDLRGFGRTALDRAHRSPGAAYGRTSWALILADIEHWLKHLAETCPGVPLFLMGHSMGGGLTLAFPTRTYAPPAPETLQMLSGVIASSPLVHQSTPAPGILRWAGGMLSRVVPNITIPAVVPSETLSHNAIANAASANDPLILQKGSLRILDDMLSGGERLLREDYAHWPPTLPVLFVHGTDDKVTSQQASEAFYTKIPAQDKTYSSYPGGYHELVHEPDGVSERLVAECIAWVEARITPAAPRL